MEQNTSLQQQLLEAGVHFGHLRKKWNPKMLPYIFAEKKGIHIIDLNKTVDCLQDASAALKQIAKSGKKIMFVATKKQAKEIVNECARRVNMPYATERWLGGMLTNFNTVRKSVKKMQSIEKMLSDGSAESLTKKERLTLSRDREKMEKVLGGIAQLGRLPAALFLVDIGDKKQKSRKKGEKRTQQGNKITQTKGGRGREDKNEKGTLEQEEGKQYAARPR
jgi:small subunit ribosomal protein S2